MIDVYESMHSACSLFFMLHRRRDILSRSVSFLHLQTSCRDGFKAGTAVYEVHAGIAELSSLQYRRCRRLEYIYHWHSNDL